MYKTEWPADHPYQENLITLHFMIVIFLEPRVISPVIRFRLQTGHAGRDRRSTCQISKTTIDLFSQLGDVIGLSSSQPVSLDRQNRAWT